VTLYIDDASDRATVGRGRALQLPEQIAKRLRAAGIGPADAGLAQLRAWNATVGASPEAGQ
jgi:phage tail tape-measure protein